MHSSTIGKIVCSLCGYNSSFNVGNLNIIRAVFDFKFPAREKFPHSYSERVLALGKRQSKSLKSVSSTLRH